MKISIAQQIEEVEREIKLRIDVYRRIETTKPSKRSEHEFLLARMRAVLATLQFLEQHREAWLEFVVKSAKEKGNDGGPERSTDRAGEVGGTDVR